MEQKSYYKLTVYPYIGENVTYEMALTDEKKANLAHLLNLPIEHLVFEDSEGDIIYINKANTNLITIEGV